VPFESFFGREVKGSVIMPGITFLYSDFFFTAKDLSISTGEFLKVT
jgi:hypothetical protein